MKKDENVTEEFTGDKKLLISCCEHSIILGDTGNIIKEINIRLTGFGENGNPLPQNKFDQRTENAVRQFQTDYMKLDKITGIICKDTLEALDTFMADIVIPFSNFSCSCSTKDKAVTNKIDNTSETNNCQGFGDGGKQNTYIHKYKKNKTDTQGNIIYKDEAKKIPEQEDAIEYTATNLGEALYAYEHPGMHRSLLWGFRALVFYMGESASTFSFWQISSGYRCRNNSTYLSSLTTNHMGKAIDIQFKHNGVEVAGKSQANAALMGELCDAIHTKLGVTPNSGWGNPVNRLAFEPTGTGSGQTWSWLHLDVRTFQRSNPSYLADEFFVTTLDLANGSTLISLIDSSDSGVHKNINSCSSKFVKKASTSTNQGS